MIDAPFPGHAFCAFCKVIDTSSKVYYGKKLLIKDQGGVMGLLYVKRNVLIFEAAKVSANFRKSNQKFMLIIK